MFVYNVNTDQFKLVTLPFGASVTQTALVEDTLYVLCIGDENRISAIDLERKNEMKSYSIPAGSIDKFICNQKYLVFSYNNTFEIWFINLNSKAAKKINFSVDLDLNSNLQFHLEGNILNMFYMCSSLPNDMCRVVFNLQLEEAQEIQRIAYCETGSFFDSNIFGATHTYNDGSALLCIEDFNVFDPSCKSLMRKVNLNQL